MKAQIWLDSNCTCTLNVNLPTDINYWIFVLLTKCVACDHIYLEKTWSLSHLMKHMAGIKCSFSSLFNGGMSRGVLLRLVDREGFVCIRWSASTWSTWLCSCCSSEACHWRLCYLQSPSPPQTRLQPKEYFNWSEEKNRLTWNKLRLRLWVECCLTWW